MFQRIVCASKHRPQANACVRICCECFIHLKAVWQAILWDTCRASKRKTVETQLFALFFQKSRPIFNFRWKCLWIQECDNDWCRECAASQSAIGSVSTASFQPTRAHDIDRTIGPDRSKSVYIQIVVNTNELWRFALNRPALTSLDLSRHYWSERCHSVHSSNAIAENYRV